ncbi:E3 ubiquitin-protein ligase At1g63170 isoform X2 [Malania oleifera]|uniref:E3 ubiquitin-protein ligase At1g63170 isoform X2 n=1 Tax=Malania oleifera TaxID=397392 RepID=UPI0025AE0067|nr:E3 ubiquitin-protein ligase At1g63170 isoform X2 [Malania oleifera]XP_057959367.1 E3 ubiquitin-protein ligase At1g63170 isoform X2 [Malania oleifera]XP_057959369.1 E3 ubiquitin-protein ligase At1g63170 isoform X2 [Malania oleifera]
MERLENHNNCEHIIDVTRSGDVSASSSSSSHGRPFDGIDPSQHEETASSNIRTSVSQPPLSSSDGTNSRNSIFVRRAEGHVLRRRRRSPLNSKAWISFEFFLTVVQIVASIVVLSLSRHEHPHAPLFAWIVGYASGCVATLPVLCWRCYHRNEVEQQDISQRRHGRFRRDFPIEPIVSLRVTGTSEGEENRTTITANRSGQFTGALSARLQRLVEFFKMALDCFFAVWFVVGNVWVFGGHSSSSEAPNLYSLCIVFLTLSCIGYAMPFLLCATICCCLPCLISVLGIGDDLRHTRGATQESISALPTYKFKLKKNRSHGDREINLAAGDGGVVAAGTEKERVISGEDAVCCICLAKYANNDELRELSCSHFFHKECVDKWLKINAVCPLCKCEVGESNLGLPSDTTAGQQRHEIRVGNSLW